MLKKILSISMVVVLLLASGAYFPENAEARGQGRKFREKAREQVGSAIYKRQVTSEVYRQQRVREQVTAKVYRRQLKQEQVAAEVYRRRGRVAEAVYNRVYSQREFARIRAAEIKRNQTIIKALNREIRVKMKVIQKLINELREDPELFPAEKAAAVREQLRLIREMRAKYADTLGEIREERAPLKENRKNNGAGLRGNLDNIFAVQEARIRILRDILAEIDELVALLR
jgi:protein-arginine kinase activator protein McsA